MNKTIFVLVLALALTGEIYPQAQSGTIVGAVTDQTGAVIPGANVRLVNEGTQFTRTALTNANGQYVAYSVPTGGYTITVEHTGFQKLVRTGIRLGRRYADGGPAAHPRQRGTDGGGDGGDACPSPKLVHL